MKGALDQFFTPDAVASKLIAHLGQDSPRTVLDPAAGDGALLHAAAERWPDADLVGLDCDPQRLRGLPATDRWTKGRCDFLSEHSRKASPVLRELGQSVDVVVLNPPYTARGGARWVATIQGTESKCSRAMAFVLTALEVVRDGGELIALLPSSVITSQRDIPAWSVLSKVAEFRVVEQFPRGTFPEGTARTIGVIIKKTSDGREVARPPLDVPIGSPVVAELIRGVLQVHAAKSSGLEDIVESSRVPYLHTTNLRDGALSNVKTLPATIGAARTIGPAVLVPRVGKPLQDKLAVWSGGEVVLSDCLFALETSNLSSARKIARLLEDRFEELAAAYAGSCAPYLTIAALLDVLRVLGIGARWRGPARWATPSPTLGGAPCT